MSIPYLFHVDLWIDPGLGPKMVPGDAVPSWVNSIPGRELHDAMAAGKSGWTSHVLEFIAGTVEPKIKKWRFIASRIEVFLGDVNFARFELPALGLAKNLFCLFGWLLLIACRQLPTAMTAGLWQVPSTTPIATLSRRSRLPLGVIAWAGKQRDSKSGTGNAPE